MADGSTGLVSLVARPHPFQPDTYYAEAVAGQTIAELLGPGARHSLRVEVGGVEVPAQVWHRVKPKAGQQLTVTAFPQGGGNNNKLLKIVVVIVAFAYLWYTGFTDWHGAGQILAYGFTAVNLLVPPPQPKLPNGADPFDPLQSLTGTQNRAAVYSPIPFVIGTVRFYPTHAALPYTEISGADQYLRMLLDLGPGTLDVTDITIGETDIASYDDVEWEISTNPTLFANDIFELQVGTSLNTAGSSDLRAGQSSSSEMSLDLQFPTGLFGVDKKGNDVVGHVGVSIQYRLVGSSTWNSAASAPGLSLSSSAIAAAGGNFTVTGSAHKALRVGVRWTVPVGQYEVQVTRNTTSWDNTTSANYSDMVWTVLRSISSAKPSTTGNNYLAIRIRATDQLNQVVSTVSVLASQRIRTWDRSTGTWTYNVATANNAWVYHWLLTNAPSQAVARPVAETRVDIDAIADWADDCTAMGYTYNQLEQSGRTLFDLLKDVLASGRATFGMRNGKYSCVRDVAQTVPVQLFTPANSWDFRGERAYFDPPHALRCQFINPEANNQQDERIVYAAGYDASNATRFEPMDLRMCTDPGPVWRLGTYHLEAADKRQNTYSWMADVENLVCERGDLVHVAHDVVEWGAGSGRIKSIAADRLSVTLDGAAALKSGALYAMQVRADNAVQQVINTTTTGNGDVSVFAFASALPSNVQVGDLCVIGDRTLVTTPLIVQMIQPQGDLTARLTGVDAAPTVPAAGTGTPPPFVSAINGKPWCAAPDLPDVTIRIGDSPPDDAGVIHAQPGVYGSPKPGIHRIPIHGPGCVLVDSEVIAVVDGQDVTKRAGDVQVGDTLRLFDPVTLAPTTGVVSYSEPTPQPCVVITTRSGKRLRCSTSAPIPTQHGGLRTAPNVAGQAVAVRVDGVAQWEEVASVRVLGRQMVQHITCENGCFWADDVGHHNLKPIARGDD
jgi:mRNA-degrading endonuclease toxin of MazEF toxin-antitoxin module